MGLDTGPAGRQLFGLAAGLLGGFDLARAKVVSPYEAPVPEVRRTMIYDQSELEARGIAARETLYCAVTAVVGVLGVVNSIGFWIVAQSVVAKLPEIASVLRLCAVLP